MPNRENKGISQNITMGHAIGSKVNISQDAVMGDVVPVVTNANEMVQQLNSLVQQLNKHAKAHPDVAVAQDELRAAAKEAQKAKPEPSAISRFLRSAKGYLEDAASVAGVLVPIVKAIGELIKVVPGIFGG